jgi:hypothetical protein
MAEIMEVHAVHAWISGVRNKNYIQTFGAETSTRKTESEIEG